MSNNTKLEDLKKNPIFQLSLSSKELFHSNFLYWLATTEELIPIFCATINGLLSPNDSLFIEVDGTWKIKDGTKCIPFSDQCVVLREYNNFDLCICEIKNSPKKQTKSTITVVEDGEQDTSSINTDEQNSSLDEIDKEKAGKVLFVLENKFKSICTCKQLDEYNQKILKLNKPYYKNQLKELAKKNNSGSAIPISFHPKCLLLSLAEEFSEKTNIEKIGDHMYGFNNTISVKGCSWAIASYKDFAECLRKQLCNIQNTAGEINLNNNTLNINLNSLGLNHLIINSYVDFISFFAKQTQVRLQKINKCSKLSEIFEAKDFEKIRCADIWQKIALHKVVQMILEDSRIKKLYADNKIDFDGSLKHIKEEAQDPQNLHRDKIYISVDLLHAQGLLTVKRILDNNYCLEIELHGGNLCLGIDFFPGCRDKYVRNRPKDQNKKKEWETHIKDKILEPSIGQLPDSAPFVKPDKVHAYQNNDNSGYYYYVYDYKLNNKPDNKSVCLALTIDKIIRWITDEKVNKFTL